MMIKKKEPIAVYPKNAKFGVPIRFDIHWDTDTKEYVLCRKRLFGWDHYTREEVKDLKKIEEYENYFRIAHIVFTILTGLALIMSYYQYQFEFIIPSIFFGIIMIITHIERRYWSTKYYTLEMKK